MAIRRLPLKPSSNEILPVLIHASLGGLSITLSYYVLNLIPLGDATTIRFSLPIWTLIIGFLALNESCGFYKLGAIAVSITGVLLIAKPGVFMNLAGIILHSPFTEATDSSLAASRPLTNSTVILDPLAINHWLGSSNGLHLQGCFLALGSSFTLAMSLVANRMCTNTPIEVIIVWLSLMTIVLGSTTLAYLEKWQWPDNKKDIILIALNGFCGTAGQWFMTNALKVEQSSTVALVRTFDIEVAFLYSAFLLHEHILITRLVHISRIASIGCLLSNRCSNHCSVLGSVFVVSGVLLIGLPKYLEACRKSDRVSGD